MIYSFLCLFGGDHCSELAIYNLYCSPSKHNIGLLLYWLWLHWITFFFWEVFGWQLLLAPLPLPSYACDPAEENE